jgi:uncharacterized membrane protein YkvA (DUF1232 family)
MDAWAWLGVAIAINVAVWLVFVGVLLVAGRRTQARELVHFLPDCARLFKRLSRDPRVPRRAKLMLVVLAAYLLSPIDLVPDFLPIAGLVDDAVLAALAAAYLVRKAGRVPIEEHWSGSEAGLRVVLALAA